MGSFYLVNLILAIVAMSYDDCRKQDQDAADEELAVCLTLIQSVHVDIRQTSRQLLTESIYQRLLTVLSVNPLETAAAAERQWLL